MANKNTVIALLTIFVVICAYNLFWTYKQFTIDSERSGLQNAYMAAQNKPDSLKTPEELSSDSLTGVHWREYTGDAEHQKDYEKAIKNSFSLGLDLQGGMFVTLNVNINELLQQLASGNRSDKDLVQALKLTREQAITSNTPFVDLFASVIKDIEKKENKQISLGTIFSDPTLGISFNTPNDEVTKTLKEKAEASIDRTFEIVRNRIDQFGVVSPNLTRQPGTSRILLELPGVREPERVRELLRSTAKLEFWKTHPLFEAQPVLIEINNKLRRMRGLVDATATDSTTEIAANDSSETVANNDSIGSDTSTLDTALTDEDLTDEEREQKAEEFRKDNPLWAVLQAPQIRSNREAYSPRVGFSHKTDTAKVNEFLRMPEMQVYIPSDMKFSWTFKPFKNQDGSSTQYFELIALKSVQDSASLGGSVVNKARADYAPYTNQPVVSLTMNSDGAQKWARITKEAVREFQQSGNEDTKRSIAITLDGKVYSYPTVQDEIKGGRTQISGNFTSKETQDMATILEAGQLPISTRIESEELVGPSLGEANIQSGYMSFILAFLVTLVFMFFYYNKAGLIADLALLTNLLFIMGCAAAFTIVLTMPGVAALVLTVGMAVDANVLIFERIREEQSKGKTLKASIKSGFSNAFSSVMDANITTFLVGVILYAFGVGPIRGFAVTLMIGIVTSLIAALIITRLILTYYANRGNESIAFGFPFTTGLFDRIKIDMVHKRKKFYVLSAILVSVFVLSMIFVGFKTGVDFNGGRQFVVAFHDDSNQAINLSSGEVEKIRKDLQTGFNNQGTVVKTMSSNNQLMITTSFRANDIDPDAATDDVINRMTTSIQKSFPAFMKGIEAGRGESTKWIIQSTMVGPTLANDIKKAALYSVIFSLIVIFLYILLRFRKWQYSAGAIAALFHDVAIVLGVFSIFKLVDPSFFNVEINQALIAALLTIIGYSINDTVVVFDRIRENIDEMKSKSLRDIYNVSIDETISRTVITSVTTFITALILFLFGGEVLRGFTFAIMIGIIVGTYSSIFIASPISLDLILRTKGEEQELLSAKKKKPNQVL